MRERKTKKDTPSAVVSRAACVSRALLANASRPALAGWGRPAWSLHVNLLSTIFPSLLHPMINHVGPKNRVKWFLVFDLLYHHTASNSIIAETHTRSAQ